MDCFLPDNLRDDLTPEDPHKARKSQMNKETSLP